MDDGVKNHVCSSIYRQFPEVRGSNPSVTSLPAGKYQLIFHGKAQTADGKIINRTVRVTTNEMGKVLKMTTSR